LADRFQIAFAFVHSLRFAEVAGLGSKVGLEPVAQHPDMAPRRPEAVAVVVDMVEAGTAAEAAGWNGTMMAATTANKSACGIERRNTIEAW
jgi:hypothetical protein